MWVISFVCRANLYIGSLAVKNLKVLENKLWSGFSLLEICTSFCVASALEEVQKIAAALEVSTEQSSQRGNSEVNGMRHCLSNLGVGAQLLAEANKNKRLNQRVNAAFHVCHPWRKNP
jgi:hypothetical protein